MRYATKFFLDAAGNTRFSRIWDQGGSTRPSPAQGSGVALYDYGAEISADNMNEAIAAASTVGVSAVDLEPQSQMADQSHGTHVASIAAGNHGAPKRCSRAS